MLELQKVQEHRLKNKNDRKKDYNPKMKETQAMEKSKNADIVKTSPVKVEKKPEEKKVIETPKENKTEGKEKKSEVKLKAKTQPKVKRDSAVVNTTSLGISTKQAVAICKFIKYKKIRDAVDTLEEVIAGKRAVPMKGEYAHRKGKIMSGKFPKKSAEVFITLIRSLGSNSNANGLDEPVISEAIANIASRPYGRRGMHRKKKNSC